MKMRILALIAIILLNYSMLKDLGLKQNNMISISESIVSVKSLQDSAGFKNAEIMEKIPMGINNDLNDGLIKQAETVTSNAAYYDGRNNLNAIHVDCNKLSTNQKDCFNNAQCGWCGENGSCINGTPAGPISPCLRDTFLYTNPSEKWNPLKAGDINIRMINDKKQPTVHLTGAPDLSQAKVYDPYH